MFFFFFNDTATTEIYTLSLHDALPIWIVADRGPARVVVLDDHARRAIAEVAQQRAPGVEVEDVVERQLDRKSTRLNSSHANISYAVFCLKKNQTTLALNTSHFFNISKL